MPNGMMIMQWTERGGAKILGRYPNTVKFQERTLLQVYSTHEYSGELGMVSLVEDNNNVASYYLSKEHSCYLLLSLNSNEEPDAFEDGMADVARTIRGYLDEEEKLLPLLPSLYRLLATYPSMKEEQRLARMFQDENRCKVFQILRDEGVYLKAELDLWLRDLNKGALVDLDAVIDPLVKEGLVKGATVKLLVTEVLFFTRDMAVFRRPPTILFNECVNRGLPSRLRDAYQNEVKNYFSKYQPTEEDSKVLFKLMGNVDTYEILSLMREKVLTQADLRDLKEKGLTDVDAALKELIDCDVLYVFKDAGATEYYTLGADIIVRKFFPEYILNVVQHEASEHRKADAVLLEHLNLLEEIYNSSKINKLDR